MWARKNTMRENIPPLTSNCAILPINPASRLAIPMAGSGLTGREVPRVVQLDEGASSIHLSALRQTILLGRSFPSFREASGLSVYIDSISVILFCLVHQLGVAGQEFCRPRRRMAGF